MTEDEQTVICKICLQTQSDTEQYPTCHPCKCTGTLKYVHKSCLSSWLNSKNIKKCELCFFEYKFNNVYKETMPKDLNLLVILKIFLFQMSFCLKKAFRIFVNVSLSMLTTYSLSFFYSFVFLRDKSLLVDYHFFGGPMLSFIFYGMKVFFKKIDKKLEELENRRTRVGSNEVSFWYDGYRDNRTLEESSVNEQIEGSEEELYSQDLNDLQTEALQEDINEVEERDQLLLDNNENSSFHLDRPSLITFKACLINLSRGLFYLLLLKAFLVFVPFFKKVILFFKCNFINFLEVIDLTDFFCHIFSITFGLLILTFSLRKHRLLFYRSKIITVLFINLILNPSLVGIFVKYCLFYYLNKNSSLFNNVSFHTPLFLSINIQILISYFIGIIVIISVTKIFFFTKKCTGLVHYILFLRLKIEIQLKKSCLQNFLKYFITLL